MSPNAAGGMVHFEQSGGAGSTVLDPGEAEVIAFNLLSAACQARAQTMAIEAGGNADLVPDYELPPRQLTATDQEDNDV